MTLVEMVIAMLIMAIAVVTIVGALTTMIQLTSQHRGHAVVEVGSRNFGQAVQQQAQFTTKLTADVSSGATSLPVADTSLLPRADNSNLNNYTYVLVDREVMRVTAISATALTVVRNVNSDPATAHLQNAAVVPVLRCPTIQQLTPAMGTYEAVTGVQSVISSVEYWSAQTNSFTDRSTCTNGVPMQPTKVVLGFDDLCDDPDSNNVFVLPECGYGYFRATIDVTTPGDIRLRSVTTSTTILLRAGSS